MGKYEGMMDILKQLVVRALPACSQLLKRRVMRLGVLKGNLLPTWMVESLLVGRENELVVLLARFRFVLGAKSEGKVSIWIRQLRGSSSGTARARSLWQLAEDERGLKNLP